MDTVADGTNLGSLSLQDPSSVSTVISKILKLYGQQPSNLFDQNKFKNYPTFLHNYRMLFNKDLNLVYCEAEVRSDSLDKGKDPDEYSLSYVKRYGAPGDIPAQYISQRLGGDGLTRNVYLAKPNRDLSEYERSQNTVYNFVKDRQDRKAKLSIGIIYEECNKDDEPEWMNEKNYFRPLELCYKFELFENDKIVGTALENKIDNKLP
uniref:Uncharacterized protein n=1 Tax=Panagrolaimus sp. ES5 TaxID=591445 RepID=A0AC34FLS8_9BILA